MKMFILAAILAGTAGLASGILYGDPLLDIASASTNASITLPFHYAFSNDGKLNEVGDIPSSTSPYWWLNSGAYLYLKDGVGKTINGDLPANDPRRLNYKEYNPGETDNGYRPQNIFRLIFRTKWQDIVQSAYYRITYYKLSSDQHRSESNGILLFNRYMDGDNTYYAGLRVDGYAVIKKKKAGTYYTMAYKQVIPGPKYDRATNPNVLPIGTWIGLKTDVRNVAGGKVSIKLYADIGKTGTWTQVADVIDDGTTYGGAALTQAGHGGIRTDFMDVEFDDYRIAAPPAQ